MTGAIGFRPASAFSLDALADIFTRAFEGYYYPAAMTAAFFAARLRLESIDLHRSVVMLAGDEAIGVAVLGLRGERAWCGGFGMVAPFRGRGLAHRLTAAMLDQARAASARECLLEVLTRNQPAIATYARAGFQTMRDLRILEWRATVEAAENQESTTEDRGLKIEDSRSLSSILYPPSSSHWSVIEVEPARLLERFAALHPAPAAWQRDLPTLLMRGKLLGLALDDGAYALISETPDGAARIEDLGAESAKRAAALLGALQRRYPRLVSVNEPADSPITTAFDITGFAEIDRQHEMVVSV